MLDWLQSHNVVVTAIATAVSAMATAAIGVFSWLQTRINAAQTESNRRIERAYVFVRVDLHPAMSTTDGRTTIEAIARYSNKGKTPAVLTQIRGYLQSHQKVPHRLLVTANSDAKLSEGLVVAGDMEFTYPTRIVLTDTELREIESGVVTLYFMGKVQYRDIFGHHHDTSFCWRMQKGYVDHWRFKFAGDSELNATT